MIELHQGEPAGEVDTRERDDGDARRLLGHEEVADPVPVPGGDEEQAGLIGRLDGRLRPGEHDVGPVVLGAQLDLAQPVLGRRPGQRPARDRFARQDLGEGSGPLLVAPPPPERGRNQVGRLQRPRSGMVTELVGEQEEVGDAAVAHAPAPRLLGHHE